MAPPTKEQALAERKAGLVSALQAGLDDLALTPSPPADLPPRLADYLLLLQRWNRVYNLTAVRDLDEMVALHLLDSLAIAPLLRGEHFIDVGSGAGLPGIPLALANPGWRFTLLDASAKRVRFLRQAAIELGLKNVFVQQGRVETLPALSAPTAVIARAFSAIDQLVALCAPLYSAQQRAIIYAMKGQHPAQELAALARSAEGAQWCYQVHRITVPGLSAARHLVELHRSKEDAEGQS